MEIYNGIYCVYVHTNKINGKKYVGQTCQNVERRWRDGEGYKESPRFYNAIKKYGWDGFYHEIIASNLTIEESNHFEELLINKLNTTNELFGYNLSSGGENKFISQDTKNKLSNSLKGKNKSVQMRNKLSKSRIGNNNPMFGKRGVLNPLCGIPKTEEHKLKLSKSNKGKQSGENHPMFGKHHKQESIDKMKKSHKGLQSGESHPMFGKHHTDESKIKNMKSQKNKILILCQEKNIIFQSIGHAAKYFNIGKGSILYAIKNNKTVCGCHLNTVYDYILKDNNIISGAITLGIISEEDIEKIIMNV